jgi:hypothetical protein
LIARCQWPSEKLIDRCTRVRQSILLLLAIARVASPQTASDFRGLWIQESDRSQPKRSGDVTLDIKQNGPELTAETSISPASPNSRHAVEKYTTDALIARSRFSFFAVSDSPARGETSEPPAGFRARVRLPMPAPTAG